MFKSNMVLIMIIISIFSGADLSSFMFSSTPSTIEMPLSTMENEEVVTFNKDLKLYIGNNLQGSQIRTLINMIQTSNTTHPDKQIILSLNSIEHSSSDELLEAINDINLTDSFTVYFEYSPSGFINKAVINKNMVQTPSPSPSGSPSNNTITISPTADGNTVSNSTESPAPTVTPTATATPTPTPTPTPISGNVSTTVTF